MLNNFRKNINYDKNSVMYLYSMSQVNENNFFAVLILKISMVK